MDKAEVEVKKQCPFLGTPCIREKCELFIQLQQNIMGLIKIVGSCSFPALAVIMSTNRQQPPQPQSINLPHLKG